MTSPRSTVADIERAALRDLAAFIRALQPDRAQYIAGLILDGLRAQELGEPCRRPRGIMREAA